MSDKNKVIAIKDGPLALEGNFRIKGVDGSLLTAADKVFLCRCGKSNKKPLCDGTHRK